MFNYRLKNDKMIKGELELEYRSYETKKYVSKESGRSRAYGALIP